MARRFPFWGTQCLACWRSRPRDRKLLTAEEHLGEGAEINTRGACAPQNKIDITRWRFFNRRMKRDGFLVVLLTLTAALAARSQDFHVFIRNRPPYNVTYTERQHADLTSLPN